MDVATSERYRALTDRQKVFVTAYLASGNAVKAVREAYRCKSDQTARVMTYQLLQHPRVADCIAELKGKTERDIQIEGLRRDLWKCRPGGYERARFLSMYLQLTGLLKPPTEAELRPDRQAKSRAKASKITPANPLDRVPADATPLADKNGIVRGYKTADGKFVQLADVEAL
jgi:Terminase small subunit